MDIARRLEILDEHITAANDCYPDDFQQWQMNTGVALRAVLGQDSLLYKQYERVAYSPSISYEGQDRTGYRPAGVKQAIAILQAAKNDLSFQVELETVIETDDSTQERETAAGQGRVFIVHGHAEQKKHELARVLHALTGAEPVILHEQPNGGMAILEKLEAYAATAGFAVVLLTADDVGRSVGEGNAERSRARQNVVFEAGYFTGRLGRKNVVILYEAGVELPSDLQGVVYVPLDGAGAWKMKTAHELANSGYDVDWAGAAGQ